MVNNVSYVTSLVVLFLGAMNMFAKTTARNILTNKSTHKAKVLLASSTDEERK